MVSGFRLSGVHCGLKPEGELDLGMIAADVPVPTAAVFTQNRVKAAPVQVAQDRLERGRAQVVLVNSGCANACTGEEGLRAVRETTGAVAEALDVDMGLVIPASTGVIGKPLSIPTVESGVPSLVERLPQNRLEDFAQSILTTDRWPKVAHRTYGLEGGAQVNVVGVAKGAGMIHPQMATTLGFVMTDAPMSSAFLHRTLRLAVDRTFNAVTVDGETSTNDMVLAMASGRVESEPLRGSDRDASGFARVMQEVLGELSESIVRDGEGATKVVRIEVVGAPSEIAARQVAERVACSNLVKTSLFGCDPNWGRLVSAAGMAPVMFEFSKLDILFDGQALLKKGSFQGPAAEQAARQVMEKDAYTIVMDLKMGTSTAHYVTSDLGHSYVEINAQRS